MISILDAKRKLPKGFIDELYNTYTPVQVDKILAGMLENRNVTLRANTLKNGIQNLMKELKEQNVKFDRVQWYNEGLIIKNAKEKQIENLEFYKSGKIYLQSLSSMIPPIVLNPKENDKVLDLTAAPGSKTTQMAMMMNNKGFILANELDKLRCERLKYNIDMQGASIVKVINRRGEKIGEEYSEYFDKVLLDAPCSGEGRFIASNVKTYRNWSEKTVKQLSKLQKKLLLSAYKALKPKGIMVYSTCTLNREENEEVLNWAIQNMNIKILDINLEIKERMKGFTEGIDKNIEKAVRILPSKNMEGFFIAKIKKI